MTTTRRSAAQRSAAAKAFPPQKSGRKSDQVFDQLSGFIHDGRFPPGGRLPPERDLTRLFNTSRQTIREAIYRAELVGLIEVRHGTGSFVIARKPQPSIDRTLVDLIKTEVHRIGEFFEIRRALEGWCAGQAAKVRTERDLEAMWSRLDAMRVLDVTSPEWEANDIAFHQALAAATDNPVVTRMMDILRESFTAFYRLTQ